MGALCLPLYLSLARCASRGIRRLEAATGRDLPYHLDYCINRPLGVICIADAMHMFVVDKHMIAPAHEVIEPLRNSASG